MAADAASSNVALLNLLAGLPKTLFGSSTSTTTTGGGSTTQTMFSQEAIDSLLKGLLEGTTGRPGLAAIASGQKAPGLYNSTSRGLLVNDFATRAAAEVATAAAPKVTTENPKTVTAKVPGSLQGKSGLGTLALIGGLAAGSKAGKKKVDELIGGLKDIFNTGEAASGVLGAAPSASDILFGGSSGFGNLAGTDSNPAAAILNGFGNGGGGGFDIANIFNYADGSGAIDSIGAVGDVFTGFDVGSSALESAVELDNFNPELASSLGFDTGGFGLPAGTGKLISGDVEGAAGSFLVSQIPVVGPVITLADSFLGTNIGGQVGNKVFDDILGITDGKVICTELARQGKLSYHLYKLEAQVNLLRLSPVTLAGYHYIAIPVVQKMRKSAKLSDFLLPWVTAYCSEVLYSKGGFRGKFVRYALEPLCFAVGVFVGKQDYKVLYQGV